jgi:hypothetical protein
MKSKFKSGAYILAVLVIVFTLIEFFTLSLFLMDGIPLGLIIFVNLLFIFSWVWLVFGELRTKVVAVDIGYDNFIVKGFFGLGKPKTYYFNEVEGYKTSILPAKLTVYEYLYVMSGGKKVIKLSQFYHQNYEELKTAIATEKINYLGFEDFSYMRELKEIFF